MSQGKAENIVVYNALLHMKNVYPTLNTASEATGVGHTTLTLCLRAQRHNGHYYDNMLFFYEKEFSESLLQKELSKVKILSTEENNSEVYKDVTIDDGRWLGLYKVSNLGNIYSIKSNKLLTPTINKFGYTSVTLYGDKKRKYQFVHRLVANEFLEKDSARTHVNHINEIRSDNRACNLEYVTPLENNNSGNHSKSSVTSRYRKIISINVLTLDIREHENPSKAFEYTDVFTEDILLNCKNNPQLKDCCRGYIFYFSSDFDKDKALSIIESRQFNGCIAFDQKDTCTSIYPIVGISLNDGSIIEFKDEHKALESNFNFVTNACNTNYFHSNIYKHYYWFYKKEDERWISLQNFDKKYSISNYGRIRITATGKIMKPIMQNSYFVIHLHSGKKTRRASIHTLVVEAFMGTAINKHYCVNHINECKTCNCLWNLEVVTYKQNTHHGNCISKISHSKMVPVVAYNLEQKRSIYANSIQELAMLLNVSHSAISLCVNSKNSTNKNYINGFCIYTKEEFSKLGKYPAPSDFNQISVNEKITNSTKVAIVSINKNSREVTCYDSYKDAIRHGYSKGALSCACHGRYKNLGHLYKGSLWFFQTDFEDINPNQEESTLQFLKTEGGRKCRSSVIAISLTDFEISRFESPRNCAELGFEEWNVSKACRGKANHKTSSHLYKHHFWFYEDDYVRMKQKGMSVQQMCGIITSTY